MPTRKQRNRALKRKRQFIDTGDLAPGVAAGITQDVSIKELRAEHKGTIGDSIKVAQHMNKETKTGARGGLRPHFVAQNSITGLIREAPDGRRFADVELTFTKDILDQIRAGMICLKCLEPQDRPFEDYHLKGCEGVLMRGPHYMRDWQIVDLALEFEGETHIGPSKPMAEHDAEIEERRLKRQFDRKVLLGRSPMKGLRHAS